MRIHNACADDVPTCWEDILVHDVNYLAVASGSETSKFHMVIWLIATKPHNKGGSWLHIAHQSLIRRLSTRLSEPADRVLRKGLGENGRGYGVT